jgi:hypothetical protein
MKRALLMSILCPIAALALVACDSDSNNGGGGGGGGDASCTDIIPMQVTGELAPMYSWNDGAVSSLTVARVENLEFLAANPTACFPQGTTPGEVDERCELAYTRSALPSLENPETLPNTVNSPTMHGSIPTLGTGFPTEVGMTNENPLENGVQYQASVIRTLEDGNVECGCVRFNAGTSASDDDNCL